MKRIIASTALALMLGASTFVIDASAQMTTYEAQPTSDMYASELIGSRIYSAEKDFDSFDENTMIEDGAEREWDDIGEINDVILGRDGQVKAVVLGIGGFIGIGEKDVAVPMDQIKTVREKDDDDTFLVVKTNKEALEAAPEFKRGEVEMAAETTETKVEEGAAATTAAGGAAVTTATQETAEATEEVKQEAAETTEEMKQETAEATEEVKQETAEATAEVKEETADATAEVKEETAAATTDDGNTTTTTVPITKVEEGEATTETAETAPAAQTEVVQTTPAERPMLVRPEIEREGYVEAQREELTADKLQGMRVYGSNDEDVGEIGKLVMSSDGSSVERVVLDVGGFLGIGEREIAVTLDELNIRRTEDGSEFRAYIDATQEQLEAQPEYED